MTGLWNLFWVFFKIGAVTFGGGYAMLPMLERELVARRAWTTREQLLDYFTIAQSTPGIIAVNVATFVGSARKGFMGALAATAGVVTPSIIAITLIAMFISNFADIAWVQKAMAGVNVAVAALLTHVVWKFGRTAIRDVVGVILFAAAFCAMTFFGIPALAIIVVAAAVGVLASIRGDPNRPESTRIEKKEDTP